MCLLVPFAIVCPRLCFSSIVINMAFFHKSEMRFYVKNMNFWSIVRYILPLAIAMMTTKLLTYFSYGYIPASLTHTVKALQPFFNVLIVYLWTGEGVDQRTILSLFPIVFGVVYASVNELEYPCHADVIQVQLDRLRLRTRLHDRGRLAERLLEDADAHGHGEELRTRVLNAFDWL